MWVSQVSLQDIKSVSRMQVQVPCLCVPLGCLCVLDKPCALLERKQKINKTNEEGLKSSYWLNLIANGVTGRNNKHVGKDFIIWLCWFDAYHHWVALEIIRQEDDNSVLIKNIEFIILLIIIIY